MSFFRRFRNRSPEGATPDDSAPGELAGEQEDAEGHKLFVGGLSWDTDETTGAAQHSGEIVAADFKYEAASPAEAPGGDVSGVDPNPFSPSADEVSGISPNPFNPNEAAGISPHPFNPNEAAGISPNPFNPNEAAGIDPTPFAPETSTLADLGETAGPAALGGPDFDPDAEDADLSELAEDLDG
jgi:hypothetical protein